MDFLSGLALVLLTLVGYSIGAIIGARDRVPTPRPLDLATVVVLWAVALLSRSILGKWVAIGVWLIASGLVSFVLSGARRNKMRPKAKKEQSSIWEGWKDFSAEIGNYQGRVLLAFFYFLVVTPFGLLVRLFNDPLQVKPPSSPSFWENRSALNRENRLDEARSQF